MLTDEQIDGLSGRKLDEAVCLALGWTNREQLYLAGGRYLLWYSPGHDGDFEYQQQNPHPHHDDLGAAMSLLLGLDGITNAVWVSPSTIEVFGHITTTAWGLLATGPKEAAAETICRAFLKLKNRGR